MRDYAKVMPKFWHGETCQEVRARGSEGALVALYLMTSPLSNMLGLFSQPLLYMAEETGLGLEGARKGLQDCIDAGFCQYDERTKTVWVIEMASYQISPQLKASDNRCAGVQKDYDALPKSPFLGAFFDRYHRAFHLKNRRDFEGASKPLPSQEQEQEQEQEQASESTDVDSSPGSQPTLTLGDDPNEPGDPPGVPPCPVKRIVEAYHRELPMLAVVRELPDQAERMIRARWRSDPSRQRLQWWVEFFAYVRTCPFLVGEKTDFQADLLWLVRPTNFAKVVNGNYEVRSA